MSKLPIISGLEAVNAFNKDGWLMVRQTGSHMIMTNPIPRLPYQYPDIKNLTVGL